jgi:RimJ/RimL family protein N-acetyltransferase
MKRKYHQYHLKYKEYEILPIRKEDILLIKEWRNKQISILRQNKFLTSYQQMKYYRTFIIPNFYKRKPEMILFSYLFKKKCIGYGGLVHIDWINKKVELSFLLEPSRLLDEKQYEIEFSIFIKFMKKITFEKLKFNKIYTETFDLLERKKHIEVLEKNGFKFEGRLRQNVYKNGKYIDSLTHGYLKEEYELEK